MSRRQRLFTAAFGVALLPLAGTVAVAAEGRYLNWSGKGQAAEAAPAAAPETASPYMTPPTPLANARYNIPPSPYGQVGVMTPRPVPPQSAPQPYANLPQQPIAAPPPQPPVQQQNYQSQNYQAQSAQTQSAGNTWLAGPQPTVQGAPMASLSRPVPATAAQVPPVQQSYPQQADPQPQPMAAPRPATQQPVQPANPIHQTGGYNADGYQVPASSPYAARIASARAGQKSREANAAADAARMQPIPDPNAATAPEMSQSLSQEAVDAYIPAEQMTQSAAAAEPRYYSLHRQYGLDPDPIPPAQTSQGALLVPSNLGDDWGGDDTGGEDGGIGQLPSGQP